MSLVLLLRSLLNIKGQRQWRWQEKYIYLSKVSVTELKSLTSPDKSLLALCRRTRSEDYTDQVSAVFALKSVGVTHINTPAPNTSSSSFSSNCFCGALFFCYILKTKNHFYNCMIVLTLVCLMSATVSTLLCLPISMSTNLRISQQW